jgi:hypothetical protein
MTSEPLSLEDIMLDMSRSGSPQDLDDDDIKKMLDRVSDMGLATPSDDHNTETSSLREKELADMVCPSLNSRLVSVQTVSLGAANRYCD